MKEYKINSLDVFDTEKLIRLLAEHRALGGAGGHSLTGKYLIKYLKETILN